MFPIFNISIDKLVHKDIRYAEVLNNYQIDFCCRANRSLQSACQEKGVNTKVLIEEMSQIMDYSKDSPNDTLNWSLDILIEYILMYHHFYLWQELPIIEKLLNKLIKIHADQHPQLIALEKYFTSLKFENELHMGNEEQTLFPYISDLLMVQAGGRNLQLANRGDINSTISIMKMEHQTTEKILKNIRLICHNYDMTNYICSAHRLVLEKLKNLEKDLYQHMHLENRVLFPKALKLEKEIYSR